MLPSVRKMLLSAFGRVATFYEFPANNFLVMTSTPVTICVMSFIKEQPLETTQTLIQNIYFDLLAGCDSRLLAVYTILVFFLKSIF